MRSKRDPKCPLGLLMKELYDDIISWEVLSDHFLLGVSVR
jgi:hypothetical protein